MKAADIKITIKELVTLSKEDKLELFNYGLEKNWSDAKKESFLNGLKTNDITMYSYFTWHLNSDGIYQIINGRVRIPLILEYVKTLDPEEYQEFENRSLNVYLITGATNRELKEEVKASTGVPLNEPEYRKGDLHPEKMKLVEKLLGHSFFQNCLIQGNKNRYADRDCAELLLAFCYCDEFNDADKATLPSRLREFVKEEPPYGSDYSNIEAALTTLYNRLVRQPDKECDKL
jgi:hypothetical protein